MRLLAMKKERLTNHHVHQKFRLRDEWSADAENHLTVTLSNQICTNTSPQTKARYTALKATVIFRISAITKPLVNKKRKTIYGAIHVSLELNVPNQILIFKFLCKWRWRLSARPSKKPVV